MAKVSKWQTIEDDTDLREMRQIADKVFQFIRVTDMNDACGRDNEGSPTYFTELLLVDLNQIGPKEIRSAIQCCGGEEYANTPEAIAEMCQSYGCYAPLGTWNGNGREVTRRQARSEAHMLLQDTDAMSERMERPVNALGSTAAEYMTGDIFSALERGVSEGKHNARIMAKMHGIDPHLIDQVSDQRPTDWLPYLMGYMSGAAGSEAVTDPDLAPEYTQGYQRGTSVLAGEAVAPSWIK